MNGRCPRCEAEGWEWVSMSEEGTYCSKCPSTPPAKDYRDAKRQALELKEDMDMRQLERELMHEFWWKT